MKKFKLKDGTYDVTKLAEHYKIWVVGGNHSYEALKKLQGEFPMKKLFKTTRISLWWWPNLEDQINVNEIETLAAHHNVDQEVRKKWEFVDKLSFIRRKYTRLEGNKWTKEASESVRSALGMKTVSSVSPLLQLVQGTKAKFDLVLKIATDNQKTIKSESKFKCLQGDITETQQIELLTKVAQGTMTLDEMNTKAEEIKLDVKIKRAAALLLNLNNFDEVEKEYGQQAFSFQRRKTFFQAFKQQSQRRRQSLPTSSDTKQQEHTRRADKVAIEVPPQFSLYVEQVRQRQQQVRKNLVSEAIEIGTATHEVYSLDVKDIAHIVRNRPKFNACKFTWHFYSRIFLPLFLLALVIMDPPYGLGVADWDGSAFSPEELHDVLTAATYVNTQQHFHLVIFCEWQMYAPYLKVVTDIYGNRVHHSGPLLCIKPTFGKGLDLPNATDLALYARIGTAETYIAASPTGTNVIHATEKKIPYITSFGGKPVNPAQKPLSVIKIIVQLYAKPGGEVLDLFCGTGQVARACADLDISSVSIDKDLEQISMLQTWLHQKRTGSIPETDQYVACFVCDLVMTPDKEVATCQKCGKKLHLECATKGTSETELFCSSVCENRL